MGCVQGAGLDLRKAQNEERFRESARRPQKMNFLDIE
jgi:hypothetical protein